MTWYAAHLIEYFKLIDAPQDRYPVFENVVLIKADSRDEAFEKAEKIGKRDYDDGDSDSGTTIDGQPARVVFGGVRVIVECRDSEKRPGHGTEVTYSEFEVKGENNLQKLIQGDTVRVVYEGFE
jgi:uncharacterized protein DUF4288